MPVHDELGLRMKEYYENCGKTRLVRRMPVAIRIDGCHFHSFCRGFQKPFDLVLIESMQKTAKYLCEHIQGCVLSYQQSDEITLILVDYKNLSSDAWFNNERDKINSVAASMATMSFNKIFFEAVHEFGSQCCEEGGKGAVLSGKEEDYKRLKTVYQKAALTATFDARCFNIPKAEVTNMVYWRQVDASRNSIQMVGQANFSHRELQGKSCNEIQDMLMIQKGINWNDYPIYQKRGSCVIRNKGEEEVLYESADSREPGESLRKDSWIVDKEIPIFKGEGRGYIDKLVYVGE